MNRAVNLRMMGGFGNQMFQYAYARAYCERYGCELRTERWTGEKIFQIKDSRISERFGVVCNELNAQDCTTNFELSGYFQMQDAIIYSTSQLKEWFKWRPEVEDKLGRFNDKVLCHLRKGDYVGYGYPVVSVQSYVNACRKYNIPLEDMKTICQENPTPGFDPEYVVDFYRLSHTPILLRSNSSFSWWAAAIAENQKVYAPIIEGKSGGKDVDCDFVEGNWPRFTDMKDFITDLHVQ